MSANNSPFLQKTNSTAAAKKSANTCSKSAADGAVSLLLSLHERELAGKHVDVEFVAMAKGVELPDSRLVPPPPPSPIVQLLQDHPMILLGVQCAGAAIVLYGFMLLLSPLWTSYHMAGNVFMNAMAAPDVELIVYSASGERELARGISTAQGAFRIGGLGKGDFKITAKRLKGSPSFPDTYASAKTTPWRVKLTKSLDAVKFHAKDGPQTAEPPPKFSD